MKMKWRIVTKTSLTFLRYKYHFPFLETNGFVIVDDNRVGPLYKHIFPPALAPWLSFVGIPFQVYPYLIIYGVTFFLFFEKDI